MDQRLHSDGVGSYEAQIQEEGDFWGRVTDEALQYGIPPWVDLQRAANFKRNVSGPWDDSRMHQILFGEPLRFILAEASEVKGAKVLDLGCGAGWLSLELARNGLHVEGLDVSERQIATARFFAETNPFTENFGSLQYRVADLNALVLEKESYDVITAWGALHHILRLESLIKEVDKALKPQGKFLIFDDVDWSMRNHFFLGLGYLLLPNHERVHQRALRLVKRIITKEKIFDNPQKRAGLPLEIAETSPFEMVHGNDIIPLVQKYFTVRKPRTFVAFSLALFFHMSSNTNMTDRQKHQILRWLKRLDATLIKLRLARGTMVLIKASKRA
jgi:SAM-dependent methyltransferase